MTGQRYLADEGRRRGDSEVIEQALRRELGMDFLEQMWERATLSPDEADALAVEAQHASRPRRR